MAKFQDYLSAIGRRAFRLLPVKKNRVVFSSYHGRGYSDSPKAVAQALLDSNENLELLWLVKNKGEAKSLPSGIRPVSYTSGLRRAWAYATAKVWVDNCRKGEKSKRKGQKYMQLWHGFAMKRIEADAPHSLTPEYIKGCRQDSDQCDLMVSGSRFMTGLYKKSFWYSGAVEEWGTPRNDVFFTPGQLPQKVRKTLGLPQDRRLALYAPTFRADHSLDAYKLDADRLLHACEAQFGGQWSLLVRLHPNIAHKSGGLFAYDGSRVLDATMYPDMQELLVGCDLLLTDYSSCMFDFALSRKPCLRFATDVEDYRQDRGFYFPIDSLPFPLADSNAALEKALLGFDQQAYEKAWEDFAKAQGFCEDGKAAQRCAQWILRIIQNKE